MNKSPFDIDHQNKDIDSRIVAALERIGQAFMVLLWNESKDYSNSPIQLRVLIFLLYHNEEKRKVSYLADEFNVTKATISDSVKVLEQKGYISKTYEPHDTRSYVIHLTAKGKELARRTAFFADEILEPITKQHAEDKENMLFGLMNLIQHLNRSGVITIQRMCKTCVHYSAGSGSKPHFCRLLSQDLTESELRLDCPEHENVV